MQEPEYLDRVALAQRTADRWRKSFVNYLAFAKQARLAGDKALAVQNLSSAAEARSLVAEYLDRAKQARLAGMATTAQSPTIVVGEVATRDFDFLVIGRSVADAKALMLEAWRIHCGQTGADPDYIDDSEVNCVEGTFGSLFRDGSPLGRIVRRTDLADTRAIDRMAEILNTTDDWRADTLNDLADVIRLTGRKIP